MSVEIGSPNEDFTQSGDARGWARAFISTFKGNPNIATDEGTMIGWFANAIMRGYDTARKRYEKPCGDKAKRFDPIAPSAVPIEYRYNEPQELWETFDRGQQYGWVVSDALSEFSGDEGLTVDDIVALRAGRGYPNNRPILLVEPVRL